MKKGIFASLALACALGAGAQFTSGNLVVSVFGDGSTALSSAAAPIFLREMTTAGATVGSELAMPTAVSGANRILTGSGSSTSEGGMARSVDGRYLALTGYDAPVGTATVATTGSWPRVIGRVDFTKTAGGIDTSTVIPSSEGYSNNNIRSATSVDGSAFWTSGTGTGGGVRYQVLGATSGSTQVSTSTTNTRNVNIFAGQLYVSSGSTGFLGVNSVGTGLPTGSGNTIANTVNTGTGASSYDFIFFDLNGGVSGLDACFIADDRTSASGGVQRWDFNGTVWSLSYTLGTGVANIGARGLAGSETLGVVTLYAVTAEASANRVIRIDNAQASGSASVTTLATAATNRIFRGIDFAPISGNIAPSIDPFSVPGATEHAAFSLDFNVTDPDGPGATWSLSGQPAGMTIDSATGIVSWTPSETQGGQTFNGIQVTVNDGAGGTDTETWGVTVAETNETPVIDNPSIPGASEGSAWSVDFNATDGDLPAQTLTFSLIGAPSGMAIDGSTGTLSWTPGETDGGNTYNFTVRVTDDFGTPAFADRAVSVTVDETNETPVIDDPSIPGGSEGSAWSVDFNATDGDLPAQTLTFSLIGAPSGMAIDGSTGTLSWTPGETDGGNTYNFTVRVTDDFGTPAFADRAVSVTVDETNETPVIDDPSIPGGSEGSAWTVDFNATDGDLPAQTLTFSLIGAPSGMAIDGSTGTLSWTPGETDGGNTYNFTVRVNDDFGTPAFADRAVSVTVSETNQSPVLAAIGNQSGTANTLVTFTASATDPDLPANGLAFSLANNPPAGASIDPGTGVFTWTPTAPGSYTFDVVVTDDGTPNLSDGETITIVVVPQTATPLLRAAPVDLVGRYFSGNGSGLARTVALSGGQVVEPGIEATFTPFSDAQKPPTPMTVDLTGRAYQYDLDLGGWTTGASLTVRAGDLAGTPFYQTVSFNGSSFAFSQGGGSQNDGTDATRFRVTVTVDGSGNALTKVDRLNGSQANTNFTFAPEALSGAAAASFEVEIAGTASSRGAATVSNFTTSAVRNALTLFTPNPYAKVGESNDVTLAMSGLDFEVYGYQAFLAVAGQTFVAGAYSASPFPVWIVDPITGALDLAAGVIPGDPPVQVEADLALLQFSSAAPSLGTLGFRANVPPTRFSRGVNGDLEPTTRDSNVFVFESIPPTIDALDARQTGSGNLFGGGTALQGALTIKCDAYDAGAVVSGLRARPTMRIDFQPLGNNGAEDLNLDVYSDSGNTFAANLMIDGGTPSGMAEVTFTAIDDSGNVRTVVGQIDVQPIQIELQLSAQGLTGTNVVRAVEISVGGIGGGNAPLNLVRDVSFTGGAATLVLTFADGLVPGSAYTRISAKDPKHTLRKKVALTDLGNQQYSATIAMKTGDASNDNVIDIVDYGIVAAQFGQNLGTDTPIGYAGLHSDFTGNGFVQTADVTLVTNSGQFLSVGDSLPGGLSAPTPLPRKFIRTKDLYRAGVLVAESMDLNRDGWVTVEEIGRWLSKGKGLG